MRRTRTKLSVSPAVVCGLFLALWAGRPARANVKLAAIFTDHMVLQQQMPIVLWGMATPKEQITVTLAGEKATATAAADGKSAASSCRR